MQAVNFRLLAHYLIQAAARVTEKMLKILMVSTAMQISQVNLQYQRLFEPMGIN
jgi:hypothetical protein